MKFSHSLLALAAAAGLAGPAQALVVAGTTTGGATFARPLSLTLLSGVGSAVPYTVLPITVSAAGTYTFATTSTTPEYDPFILLYAQFNPSSSLSNLLVLNDDLTLGNLTESGFTFALTPGTTYEFVTTGFANDDFGTYTTSITGPGTVVAVPEPASYAMLALGLAGIGAVARRARRRQV